jgi:hypothetical protein
MPSHAILHSGYAAILPDLQLRGSAGFSPASHAQGESLRRANAKLQRTRHQ